MSKLELEFVRPCDGRTVVIEYCGGGPSADAELVRAAGLLLDAGYYPVEELWRISDERGFVPRPHGV